MIVKVKLEYRPCTCTAYVQDPVILKDAEGILRTASDATSTAGVAHFDFPEVAAARVRDNIKDGVGGNVHFQGLHVSAAWIDGERFPATGDL